MAQRPKRAGAPPPVSTGGSQADAPSTTGSPGSGDELSLDDIASATLHLLALSCAHRQGHQANVNGVEHARDLTVLHDVARRLLADRRQREQAWERAQSVAIRDGLAALFTHRRALPTLDIKKLHGAVKEFFAGQGLSIPAQLLAEELPNLASIAVLRGPVDAATTLVGRVLDVAPRSLFYRARKDGSSYAWGPEAFGQYPDATDAVAFVLQALGFGTNKVAEVRAVLFGNSELPPVPPPPISRDAAAVSNRR